MGLDLPSPRPHEPDPLRVDVINEWPHTCYPNVSWLNAQWLYILLISITYENKGLYLYSLL